VAGLAQRGCRRENGAERGCAGEGNASPSVASGRANQEMIERTRDKGHGPRLVRGKGSAGAVALGLRCASTAFCLRRPPEARVGVAAAVAIVVAKPRGRHSRQGVCAPYYAVAIVVVTLRSL